LPIIEIELILRPGESVPDGLAAQIANSSGEIVGTPKGGTWVKIHAIPSENYAENGAEPDDTVFPVFVSILKSRLPDPKAMQAEVTRLTETIAQICARPPENVHIIYQPPAAGRAAFGGRVAE
jgi:phenylpyruvate tautomerase PptA (4-oxalocrotonate tautomerase family)